jgi:hypothetical protein
MQDATEGGRSRPSGSQAVSGRDGPRIEQTGGAAPGQPGGHKPIDEFERTCCPTVAAHQERRVQLARARHDTSGNGGSWWLCREAGGGEDRTGELAGAVALRLLCSDLLYAHSALAVDRRKRLWRDERVDDQSRR